MKSNFATGNQLQVIGNRLPESKNSSKLENFEKNSFEKQNYAMFVFWKIFSILPLWSLLEIKILLILESCWLNLEIIILGFLSSSLSLSKLLESTWFIIMKLASTLQKENCCCDQEVVCLLICEFFWTRGKGIPRGVFGFHFHFLFSFSKKLFSFSKD